MTKEQMQAALDQANAETASAKKRIAELETENGKLSAELAAEKKSSEAKAGANAILESTLKAALAEKADLKKQIEELQAKPKAGAVDPENADAEENKNKIKTLVSAITASCADHCPHKLNEGACRNCNIYKMVSSAGFTLNKPQVEQEN